jgi:hypothetical protein
MRISTEGVFHVVDGFQGVPHLARLRVLFGRITQAGLVHKWDEDTRYENISATWKLPKEFEAVGCSGEYSNFGSRTLCITRAARVRRLYYEDSQNAYASD